MKSIFSQIKQDTTTQARTGVLYLPHGAVQTPVFMPVGTVASVKAISKDDLSDIGFNLILANTYHLFLRPGASVIKNAGGLHGFTGYNKNFLTDSGGFQVFSLAQRRKIKQEGIEFSNHIDGAKSLFTPESVVDLQVQFNSDIQMALDVCTPHGISYQEAKKATELTYNWGKKALLRWQQRQKEGYKGSLFAIVQGNFFKDLRTQSIEQIALLDTPGIAIGGLSVGESKQEFLDFLSFCAEKLPKQKPHYVMGIGTPQYLLEAIACGIDMADCVLPTRNARNGSYFTHYGMLSIKQKQYEYDLSPIDSECDCKVCLKYSRSYLRHLFKSQEILSCMLASYHNLYFLNTLMKQARDAINAGCYESFYKNWLFKFNQGSV